MQARKRHRPAVESDYDDDDNNNNDNNNDSNNNNNNNNTCSDGDGGGNNSNNLSNEGYSRSNSHLSDLNDESDSGEKFGLADKSYSNVDSIDNSALLCHDWLVKNKKWLKETFDFIEEYMINNQYFSFKSGEATNVEQY